MSGISHQQANIPEHEAEWQLDDAPVHNPEIGEIRENTFASAYHSRFTDTKEINNALELKKLEHVNCSYLSTPGRAPTVLQLKQHAQSLINLIVHFCGSTRPGLIDNQIKGNDKNQDGVFNKYEAFDFLNDLTAPYTSSDPHHHQPLTTLMNLLEAGSTIDDEVVICPLRELADDFSNADMPSLPYATHQSLFAHANDVLELLDHEYSAKGGLLGALPPKGVTDEEKEDRKLAESTFLGQMLIYIGRLVHRLHDLERLYANSLDVMNGEAVVPSQMLSRLGPEGRGGHELVYPQDRFVLANAGEDLWQYLTEEFDKKDRTDEQVRRMYLGQGVEGEALWETRGGKEYSRGLTAIDIPTRYYRLRNGAAKTIFVIPAHQAHPGTQATRDMEQQPTVVSVVKPVWPERQSVIERKHRKDMEELRLLRREAQRLDQDLQMRKEEIAFLEADRKTSKGDYTVLQQKLADLQSRFFDDGTSMGQARAAYRREFEELQAREAALDAERAALAAEKATLTAANARVQQQIDADQAALEAEKAEFQGRRAELERWASDRAEELEAEKALAVGDVRELKEGLKRRYAGIVGQTKQIAEVLGGEGGRGGAGGLLSPVMGEDGEVDLEMS